MNLKIGTNSSLGSAIQGTGISSGPSVGIGPIKQPDIKVDSEQVQARLNEAMGQLNQLMKDSGRGLNFSFDQVMKTPVVVVKNSVTGEVVRQIPNEVVIRVAHSLEQMKGLLLNEKI